MSDPDDIWSQFPDVDPSNADAMLPYATPFRLLPGDPAASPIRVPPNPPAPHAQDAGSYFMPRQPPAPLPPSPMISGLAANNFVSAMQRPKLQFGLFGRGSLSPVIPDLSNTTVLASDPRLRTAYGLPPTDPQPNPLDQDLQSIGRRDRLGQFVDTPYWRAFATTIGQSEGVGYDSINSGIPFNRSFDADSDRYPGRGAGLFQIEPPNYQTLGRDYLGIRDFTPRSQNLIAAQLVENARAMPFLMRGDISGALPILSRYWVSLPQGPTKGGRTSQPYKSYDFIMSTYRKALQDELEKARMQQSPPASPPAP